MINIVLLLKVTDEVGRMKPTTNVSTANLLNSIMFKLCVIKQS